MQTSINPLLERLNEEQAQAVQHGSGPAIVLAGAGSGKTRVLTTRVAWLIQQQAISAHEILLVTFTNKAAEEMNKRVHLLTGQSLLYSGTFHRVCARILRNDGGSVGLSAGYTIFDTADQLSVLKRIYKEHNLDAKRYKPQSVKAQISQAKNELLTPQEYSGITQDEEQEFVAKVYRWYQDSLASQQAVDFDDLLLLVVKLFDQHPDVLERYQKNFQHVLVDEYQDTNRAQYLLTRFLAAPQHNLFVVGDFSQSIYAWRGADYRNLSLLKQDFETVTEYRLEQNYRSTQSILDAATQVISVNTSHPILKLWTDNPAQDKLDVVELADSDEEARWVGQKIQSLTLQQYEYGDIAILYRTNAQSRAFEEAFIRASVPYRIVGGLKFYERREVKDVLAYARMIDNPADLVSAERITKLGKRRSSDFMHWLEANRKQMAEQKPAVVLEKVLAVTKYQDQFSADDPEDVSRQENVRELLEVASQFTSLRELLENVALVQDDYVAGTDVLSGTPNMVTLMSLHSAKGLEFPVVFMVGMEEGLLPHARSLFDKAQMEEERRLCYVGITRAKEHVFFTYARRRWTYGSGTFAVRSRFLQDISVALLQDPARAKNMLASQQRLGAEEGRSQYGQPGYGFTTDFTGQSPLKKKQSGVSPTAVTRRMVIDEDSLNAVLSGDIDITAFLDSD